MIRVLMIEDEEPAAKRLWKMIAEADPAIELLAVTDSVTASEKWLRENPAPDLIFSDIQLSDGNSFDLFRAFQPPCPVIFVTAYDQYALEAFKANGIDYILKPVKKEELQAAIAKFKTLKPGAAPIAELLKWMGHPSGTAPTFKNRFVVRFGDHIKTIQTEDIAFFHTEDKMNFLTTFEGRRYPIDYNLDELEKMITPQLFFRINRQYIISIHSIAEMLTYSKGRVLVKLNPPAKHETVVSTERSAAFKSWLGGE